MNSASPEMVYTGMLESNQKLQSKLILNARYFSFGRFSSFLLLIASIVAALTLGSSWWWSSAVMLLVFIVLIVLHEKLINLQKFNDSCISAIEDELAATKGQYLTFESGSEFIDSGHIYATDLDIFGNSSLFQAINRATTHAGKSTLAGWLNQPLNESDKIKRRQEAVKELAGLPDWRIKLRANGIVAGEAKKDLESLSEWLSSVPLFRLAIFRLAIILIPLTSVTVTGLLISGLISIQMFLLYLILPLGITGIYTKAINRRHVMLSRKVELLQKYSVRFQMIEKQGFRSDFMTDLVEKLNRIKYLPVDVFVS